MPWPSDQTPNTKRIQHLVKEKNNFSRVAALEKWQQVDGLAAACMLQRTGKETLVRGDFPPCMFLKSHWTCPSKFKLPCYNPQWQEEALVFKDSRKQNIPSTSESKMESPRQRWNAIKSAQTYTHQHKIQSHCILTCCIHVQDQLHDSADSSFYHLFWKVQKSTVYYLTEKHFRKKARSLKDSDSCWG